MATPAVIPLRLARQSSCLSLGVLRAYVEPKELTALASKAEGALLDRIEQLRLLKPEWHVTLVCQRFAKNVCVEPIRPEHVEGSWHRLCNIGCELRCELCCELCCELRCEVRCEVHCELRCEVRCEVRCELRYEFWIHFFLLVLQCELVNLFCWPPWRENQLHQLLFL